MGWACIVILAHYIFCFHALPSHCSHAVGSITSNQLRLRSDHILNTPNLDGPPGLCLDAANANPSTVRLSCGLITPSSQSLALRERKQTQL